MATLERRFLTANLAASESEGRKVIGGYAARWHLLSENLGGFRERLSARCFDIDTDDQRMLIDHDSGRLLGRKSTGSLLISQDGTGLRFRCEMPDTQDASDTYALIKRGDLDGMSFGMLVSDDAWADEIDPDDLDRTIRTRTIRRARCLEISCVSFPAYSASNVEAMSRALWPAGVPAEIRAHAIERASPKQTPTPPGGRNDSISEEEKEERRKMLVRLIELDL